MSDQFTANDPLEKNGRGKQIFGVLMILLVLALGISIGTLTTDRVKAVGPGDSNLQMPPAGQPAGGPLQALSQAFEEVSKSVSAAVVNIDVEEIVSGQRSGMMDFFEFFGSPFGNPGIPSQPGEMVVPSLGSGVIVDPKGYIITNNHVIENATRMRVSIGGNPKTYEARLIGSDPEGDIAVIKIDGDDPFPYARIGNSQNMRVGDWVLAIGSPFGLEQTVTAGIISATGRTFTGGIDEGPSRFSDYLQTDAAINRGNSGGPLVNMNGEVVGINSFISSRSGASAGLGFAVPSHIFVRIYNQILETGRFSRGWLGVGMNSPAFTPEMAKHFGVRQGSGALITRLIGEDGRASDKAGPAAKAGIMPEDVIIEFDGATIKDTQDLTLAVANTVPGKTVKVRVVRHGEEKTFDVMLAERTVDMQERQARRSGNGLDGEERPKPKPEIGLDFDDVPQRLARAMGIPGGALITSVSPRSLSDDAGLQGQNQSVSDVIVAVNGKPVTSGSDLLNIVREVKPGDPIVIKFLRHFSRDNETMPIFTSIIKP